MSLENVVNSNVINHVILANLYYDSGVVSMCNALNDIDYDNKTYMATGNLSSISSINESDELNANGIDISLSGIDPNSISRTLTEPHRERIVEILLGIRDENQNWILDPFVVFKGRMDKPIINTSNEESFNDSAKNLMPLVSSDSIEDSPCPSKK